MLLRCAGLTGKRVKMMNKKNVLTVCILLVFIPTLVLVGAIAFKEKMYAFLSLVVAIVSCVPLFYAFERKDTTASELTVLAVLIAMSAVGRFVFAWIPGFKPVTAITVIIAVWLGKEAGFVVGSLSAVISNFYFGQGPWTPFQMLSWGLIGFIAGVVSKPLLKSRALLCLYGAFAGVFYSAAMDVWTTVWADGYFNITRYLASLVVAAPATVSYAVSNVIFIWLLAKPFGEKLSRLKKKYGLFSVNEKK